MSARFNNATQAYLRNTAPVITDTPFSIFAILTPRDIASHDIFELSDGTANNRYGLYSLVSTNTINFYALENANFGQAVIDLGASYIGQPLAVIMRGISHNNRRLAILNMATGAIFHAQNTNEADPALVTEFDVGGALSSIGTPGLAFLGDISELFYTATDIQQDGGPIHDMLLRRIVYGGPLSIPHIAAAIRTRGEYRSFRSRIVQIDPAEVVWGSHAPPTWVNTNGVTLGPDNSYTAAWVQPQGDDGILPLYIRDVPAGVGSGIGAAAYHHLQNLGVY